VPNRLPLPVVVPIVALAALCVVLGRPLTGIAVAVVGLAATYRRAWAGIPAALLVLALLTLSPFVLLWAAVVLLVVGPAVYTQLDLRTAPRYVKSDEWFAGAGWWDDRRS
jgi:hypothetical protein